MTTYTTPVQRAACEAFPGADLLPFNVTDGIQATAAVQAGTTGNILFDFVFHETGDCKSRVEAYRRLLHAADKLIEIAQSLV